VTTLRERRRERWRAARPAIAWTFGAFGAGVVIALVITWSLADAQQSCFLSGDPCPDGGDPRLRWLALAFFGVPLIWLLGLLLLAVRTTTRRRG
jgi:hypothetical protein